MAHDFVKLFKSLPGHKRLIPGNHDHLKPKWYVEAGFEKLRGAHFFQGLLMTHYPVHPSCITFKVIGNVHGHVHAAANIRPVIVGEKAKVWLNVCVEATQYEPIPIEEALIRVTKIAEEALRNPVSASFRDD